MTLDASELRVDVQEHPRWRRTLRIHVPAEVVERERRRALERVARTLKVPGFRKGRAPASVVERRSQAVLQETLQRIIDEAYQTMVRARSLEPIGEGRIEGVDYDPGSGLDFRVSFDVRPVIELPTLGGFEVEVSRPAVSDEDVERAIGNVLAENAIWRPAENDDKPRDGDLVTLEIERLADPARQTGDEVDADRGSGGRGRPVEDVGLPWARRLWLRPDTRLGRRFQLVLGEGDALPALEDAVRSLAPGQTGEFSIAETPSEAGSAGPLRLRVTLQDRRMRELPDLDDAFARSLGGFRSVDELRRQVRADLEKEASDAARQELRSCLLERVVEANPFEVPESLIQRYIEARLGDARAADADALADARARLAAEAESAVRQMLVVDRIAELHALVAAPEEVEARIAEIARAGHLPPEQVRHRLAQTGRLEALTREVTLAKVVAFLAERSRIHEEGGEDRPNAPGARPTIP